MKIIIPFLNRAVREPYWVFQKFLLEIRRVSDKEQFPNTLMVLSAERSNVDFKECMESVSELYSNLIHDNRQRLHEISEGELKVRLRKFRIDEEDYNKRLLKAKIIWKNTIEEKNEITGMNAYNYDSERECFSCD